VNDRVRGVASSLLAAGVVLGLGWGTRLPSVAAHQRAALAAPFSFRRVPLLRDPPAARTVRQVEPQLRGIQSWVSSVGAGASLSDLDADGLPDDVCLVDPRADAVNVLPAPSTPQRYQPFTLDPSPLPYDAKTMAPMGCLPGDFNEDGDIDLLVYYWGRTPVLFLRRPGVPLGPDAFVRQELVSSPVPERWYTNAVTTADVDGDGHLDIVIGNYFPDGSRVLDASATDDPAMQMQDSMSRAHNSGRNRILLWKAATQGVHPSARYAEAVGALPGDVGYGWTLAVGAYDLTGDLKPDLYFANDFGPDRLLYNESTPGHVKLVSVQGVRDFTTPASKVLGRDSFKGMGVDFGDLNGDGKPDIFVSNITSEFALQESNFAFVNTGQDWKMAEGVAPFVDRSEELGLSRSGWSWDAKIADFDNSGVPQVVQATGFVKGTTDRWPELQELAIGNDALLRYPAAWPRFGPGDDISGHQPDAFYVRGPNGRYVNLNRDVGLGDSYVTRGIALGDVNGDGGLDFVLANQWDDSYLFENASPHRGSYLGLDLRLPAAGAHATTTLEPGHPDGTPATRPAVGAEATLTLPDGRRLIGQVDGGNGHGGVRAPELLFGLGRAPLKGPIRVDLSWRDAEGTARHDTLFPTPGWHTVVLAS
jgi:hypothetical protein